MNKDMGKNLRYGAILLAICAICSLALAVVNQITLPVIQNHNANAKAQALTRLRWAGTKWSPAITPFPRVTRLGDTS